jgi:hypothetical protein
VHRPADLLGHALKHERNGWSKSLRELKTWAAVFLCIYHNLSRPNNNGPVTA